MVARLTPLLLCLAGCGSGAAAVEPVPAYLSPTIPDAECEYVYRPGVVRAYLGALIAVNTYHQRSPERATVDVLVLGDSVVAGGNVAEGGQATAIVERTTGLRVASLACDGWGPQNLLAYVRKFGVFGASRAFLCVSNHDAGSVMGEAYTGEVRVEAIQAFRDLLGLLRASGVEVAVLLHHEAGHPEDREGDAAFGAVEPVVRLAFGPGDYADFIHLSAAGQVSLASQIGSLLHE